MNEYSSSFSDKLHVEWSNLLRYLVSVFNRVITKGVHSLLKTKYQVRASVLFRLFSLLQDHCCHCKLPTGRPDLTGYNVPVRCRCGNDLKNKPTIYYWTNLFRSGLSIIELFYLFKQIFEKQKNIAGPHQVGCVNCICLYGFIWVWFLSTNQVIHTKSPFSSDFTLTNQCFTHAIFWYTNI